MDYQLPLKLQEFDFTISHRPGSANENADALSRLNYQPETVQAVAACCLFFVPAGTFQNSLQYRIATFTTNLKKES